MRALTIALTGKAGAGKDTAGGLLSLLLQKAGYTTTVMAFADPIRDMLSAIVPSEYMTDRTLKELPAPGTGISYRELAQTLGTEWGRARHPDLWLRIAGGRIASFEASCVQQRAQCPVAIFTDARFPNELAWVRRRGGLAVRVERHGLEPVRAHASETAADDVPADIVVTNNGTLSELCERVRDAAPEIVAACLARRSIAWAAQAAGDTQ